MTSGDADLSAVLLDQVASTGWLVDVGSINIGSVECCLCLNDATLLVSCVWLDMALQLQRPQTTTLFFSGYTQVPRRAYPCPYQ